jgi:hypothetical protein
LTCSRDTSLTSGRRIFYSAIGDAFKKTFLLTPPAQKCESYFRKWVVLHVAVADGAHAEIGRKL